VRYGFGDATDLLIPMSRRGLSTSIFAMPHIRPIHNGNNVCSSILLYRVGGIIVMDTVIKLICAVAFFIIIIYLALKSGENLPAS